MNEVSMRPWRLVTDPDLHRWAGGGLMAAGRAIANDGRVRGLVRTAIGEAFATVVDTKKGREFFAGVVMEVDCKQRTFSSLCSCERCPCVHAVALALELRNAVAERRTPPRMAKEDRRCAELPRPELGIDYWDVPEEEEGFWVSVDVPAERQGQSGLIDGAEGDEVHPY